MTVFKQHATYSERADAAYLYLRRGKVARTRVLDETRNVDLDANGDVIGVEFLGVSGGLNFDGVPEAATVERLLHERSLPVPA